MNIHALKISLALLLSGSVAGFSQGSFRLVNGKAYNVLDSSVWRYFDNLEVRSVNPDGGLVCRCFTVHDDSFVVGGNNGFSGSYSVVNASHRVYGETILLLNYQSYQPLSPGMTLPGPIRAMLSNVATMGSTSSLTTYRGSSGNDNVLRFENIDNYPVYDCGVDYYPPEPKLTPAQIKSAIKARLAQERKTFLWVYSQATNGDVSMQCDLGEHYLNGVGTSTNRDLAIHWLRLASASGDFEASNVLARITETNSTAKLDN
ncbi:MAG TPA: hypothetical protein VGY98_00760 [Verrucomicrobiae bacterium]|nr:hypothetical protein [Verrucomicrobiae bacterium]